MMQRVLAHGLSGLDAGGPSPAKLLSPICFVLLSFLPQGCARPPVHAPVTLTLLEEWTTKTFSEAREQELHQFTQETGIRVKLLPSPESARQKLALWQEGVRAGAAGPEVYRIALILGRGRNGNFICFKTYLTAGNSAQ